MNHVTLNMLQNNEVFQIENILKYAILLIYAFTTIFQMGYTNQIALCHALFNKLKNGESIFNIVRFMTHAAQNFEENYCDKFPFK